MKQKTDIRARVKIHISPPSTNYLQEKIWIFKFGVAIGTIFQRYKEETNVQPSSRHQYMLP